MSRYVNAVPKFDDDGAAFLPRRPLDGVGDAAVQSLRLQQPERIDLAGTDYAGDARAWHLVMALNPEHMCPFDIAPGMRVRVPAP